MKLHAFLTLATLLFGFSAAAKLSNKYLPPNYAGSSAGHAGFLQGPRSHQSTPMRPSNQYLAPQQQGGRPHYTAAASSPAASSRYGHNRAAAQIPILRQEYNNDGHGNYNFGFEAGNGIRRDETGQFEGGWPDGSQSVMGSYSYTGDDGHVYTVNYKADGNGFQATGDHLPTPPPVPREIQESLARHHGGHAAPGSHGSSAGYSGHSGHGGHGSQGSSAGYGGHGSHGSSAGYGGHGGHGSQGSSAGYGGHHGSASSQSPSARYLPPQQGHSSYYARKH